MAVVWVPTQMRELTGGRNTVTVSGATLRQVISDLERQFPGFRERLVHDDRVNPTLSVIIDGGIASMGLMERVEEKSEISFVPAIGGGRQ